MQSPRPVPLSLRVCAAAVAAATVFSSTMVIACTSAQGSRAAQVIRRYPATEATQGVAVDDRFFYAIDNMAIGKYNKRTGQRVGRWEGERGGRIAHLNSGIVVGGELYSAHSNYPETPMVSSVEIFDINRMTHLRSQPLPARGSATWIEQTGDAWWVNFAHYAGRGGEAGKGPEATTLVRFDRDWRQQGAWSYPAPVVARWAGMSSSGGTWANARHLYTTGHHARELYVVELPVSGPALLLREIIAIESEGQGIALDRAEGLLYSVQRKTLEVLASKLPSGYAD